MNIKFNKLQVKKQLIRYSLIVFPKLHVPQNIFITVSFTVTLYSISRPMFWSVVLKSSVIVKIKIFIS